MPDYVYALHDFLPEHEDEVSFRAGERIEVVEKDDLYGDGWWQVSLDFAFMCVFASARGQCNILGPREPCVGKALISVKRARHSCLFHDL